MVLINVNTYILYLVEPHLEEIVETILAS
jgi:hypothetical protein